MGEIGETKGATGKGQQRLRRCTLRAQPSHLGTGRKIPQNSVIVRRRRSPSVEKDALLFFVIPARRARTRRRALPGEWCAARAPLVTYRWSSRRLRAVHRQSFHFDTGSHSPQPVTDCERLTVPNQRSPLRRLSVRLRQSVRKKESYKGWGSTSARAHSRLVPSCVALVRCVAFGRPKMSVWGHAGARSAPTKVACNPTYGTPALPPAPIVS